jgi:hypothetical protein
MIVNKFISIWILLFLLYGESQSVSFECAFYQWTWDDVGSVYNCQTKKSWNLDEPNIQSINGTHLDEKNNTDVQEIIFRDGQEEMTIFPENLHEFFPNLIVIQLSSSNIQEISSGDLRHFPELKKFYIFDSAITSVPSDLFTYNPKLTQLYIWGSKNLHHVGENLLGNLKNLEFASFLENSCINEQATKLENILELNERLMIHCPSGSPDY